MFCKLVSFNRFEALRAVSVILAASFLFCATAVFFCRIPYESEETLVYTDARERVVILDAGHGGEDGGTVGVNGVYEKDLNLSVSNILAAMLRSAGVTVIETRTEDRLLYREEENIRGYRKMYDLRNRLAVAQNNPDALFVSLHMNSFSSPQYKGLQVYYADTAGSERLARVIQNGIRTTLQPDNDREVKAAGSGIYLLDRAENTAVLIECGFLSNPEECEKLSSEDYRKQLCFSLFCGIITYIDET